jgi:phosphoglycerate kinase
MAMPLKQRRLSLHDVDVFGKRVLVRVDFNVPLEAGRVRDETRIRAALPTLNYLLHKGAAVVLMSHLGRPKGKPVPEMSLRPVAAALGRLLGREVEFVPDCLGEASWRATAALAPGRVALLENVRFYVGDEQNDPQMAAGLAKHGQLYVNDAFGAAHRAHASVSGVAAHLPAVSGLLLETELEALGRLMTNPARPFLVILGGAKVSDKFGVIASLLERCDALALGGGMANTFLLAAGLDLGRSLVERDLVPRAKELLDRAAERGVRVLLPSDLVVADKPEAGAARRTVKVALVPASEAAYDVGPDSVAAIVAEIERSATVFWNGTLGVYEVAGFEAGTAAVARAVGEATARGAVTVVAGGDSLAAAEAAGAAGRVSHLSTGGGAALELLEGRPLPGVECLLASKAEDGRGAGVGAGVGR